MTKEGHLDLHLSNQDYLLINRNLIISHRKRPPIVWSVFIKPKLQLWYKSRIVTVNVRYSMILYMILNTYILTTSMSKGVELMYQEAS
jgi:hypothetical protein